VDLTVWKSYEAFTKWAAPREGEVRLFSKNGAKPFWSMPDAQRMFLVFGSETKGLPDPILDRYADSVYRIPIRGTIRSLNLSTAVGIALYESLRPA
jgi:tRNA (cytidine/uridine-2'-O-)-methyltransferase